MERDERSSLVIWYWPDSTKRGDTNTASAAALLSLPIPPVRPITRLSGES